MARVADLEGVAVPGGSDQLRRVHTADLVAEHLRMLVFTGVLRAGDKVSLSPDPARVHRFDDSGHALRA